MDKYSMECLDQEKQNIIQKFMSGPKKFIMKICNAGSYQRSKFDIVAFLSILQHDPQPHSVLTTKITQKGTAIQQRYSPITFFSTDLALLRAMPSIFIFFADFLKLAPCFNARNKTFGATKCTDILARKQKHINKLLSRKNYKQNQSAREKKFNGNLCQ